MNFLEVVKPETAITLGFIGLMLASAVYMVVKGLFIPRGTHLRELRTLETQVAQAIKDRDEQVKAIRDDRNAQVQAIRDEMNIRMENFRADHALRMDQVREDHVKQLAALVAAAEGIRADRDVMLAAKQRDADDWRAAYHIGAENAKASEDRMDEVLETVRLIYNMTNTFRTVVAGREHPELTSGGGQQ
jgi:hypothetical protein